MKKNKNNVLIGSEKNKKKPLLNITESKKMLPDEPRPFGINEITLGHDILLEDQVNDQ